MTEDYNLYPLHVFRVVARHGSVTRAALELCISQPAVSFHLRVVESRLGETLFERTARGMLLTVAGAAVLEYANRLFGLYEDMGQAVHAARGAVRGEVLVAASSTPGAYLVPDLLRRFKAQYPQTHPRLLVGDSREALAWLHEYRVPLCVVGDLAMEEVLVREVVGADELRLVASAHDSLCDTRQVQAEDLAGRTLFLREPGSSTRAGAEALLGDLVPHFGAVEELSSTEAIKNMVIAGLGVAVLSSWATVLEEKEGLLRPIQDPRLRQGRRFYLVHRADRPLVGAVEALWNCLTTCTA